MKKTQLEKKHEIPPSKKRPRKICKERIYKISAKTQK